MNDKEPPSNMDIMDIEADINPKPKPKLTPKAFTDEQVKPR